MFLLDYWYLFLIVFLIGIISTLVLKKPIKDLYKDFVSRTPIIRRYWSFVLIFCVILLVTYLLVFKYSPKSEIEIYLNVISPVATLVFAIFIGYFAFLQLVESRMTTLKQEGFNYLKQKGYARAVKIYEQVASIDVKNFYNMAELLEIYLFQKDFTKFDEKISLLRKNTLDERDSLILFYLKISRYLLKENLLEAKEEINKLIIFSKKNPRFFNIWDFSDMRSSATYTNLSDGEVKKILDNLIQYLSASMSPENKTKFENGNY